MSEIREFTFNRPKAEKFVDWNISNLDSQIRNLEDNLVQLKEQLEFLRFMKSLINHGG